MFGPVDGQCLAKMCLQVSSSYQTTFVLKKEIFGSKAFILHCDLKRFLAPWCKLLLNSAQITPINAQGV